MSRKPCPNAGREGCPYIDRPSGCYSDIDHVTPRRYRKLGWLIGKYIDTPENKERLCRWEHEKKTAEESLDLIPSTEFMLGAVRRAFDSGYLTLNKRDQERLILVEQSVAESDAA